MVGVTVERYKFWLVFIAEDYPQVPRENNYIPLFLINLLM